MAPKAATKTEAEVGTFAAYTILRREKGKGPGSYSEQQLAEWAGRRRWIVIEVEATGSTSGGKTMVKLRCRRDPDAAPEEIAPRTESGAEGRYRVARKSGGKTLYLINAPKGSDDAAWSLDGANARIFDREAADEAHRAIGMRGQVREVR